MFICGSKIKLYLYQQMTYQRQRFYINLLSFKSNTQILVYSNDVFLLFIQMYKYQDRII